MISSEVQRTLVKSPPELWAEISDPEALARHLGEFGEIRITRVQPEQKVEWETDDASGSIAIKPSGWGTKVKLTVTREPAKVEDEPQAEVIDDPGDTPAGPQVVAAEREDAADTEPPDAFLEPAPTEPAGDEGTQPAPSLAPCDPPTGALEGEGEGEGEVKGEPDPWPDRRPGFFARLFGRRRVKRRADPHPGDASLPALTSAEYAKHAPAAGSADGEHEQAAAWPYELECRELPNAAIGTEAEMPAEPEMPAESDGAGDGGRPEQPSAAAGHDDGAATGPAEQPEQTEQPGQPEQHVSGGETPRDTPDPANGAAAEDATEHVTAVLTGVLDRLGAAHHRPFSRA